MLFAKINKYIPAVCFLILAMCASMRLYFTWKLPETIINLACAIILLVYFLKIRFTESSMGIIVLLVLCYVYNYAHITAAFSFISLLNLISLILISSYFLLSSIDFKLKLLSGFDWFLKCLCCISLIGWVLYLAGIPLPHYYSNTSDFYTHDVYYLFVITNNGILDVIPRFSGLFLEPGHLGSTACLLLYMHKFNFRIKSNYIYLFSILFSLSLAAYCLFFIGICMYYFLNGRHIMKYVLILGCFAALFVSIGSTYNSGDNIVNEKILSRLVFEDGQLSGDNRTSMLFDSYYDEWLEKGDIVWGYGRKAYGYDGSTNLLLGTASFKRFFFIQGLVGTILVALLYFILFYKFRSKQGYGFFVLYILCNMIRDYPYRLMWFYLFVCGIISLYMSEKNSSIMADKRVCYS